MLPTLLGWNLDLGNPLNLNPKPAALILPEPLFPQPRLPGLYRGMYNFELI